jgi:hypothetical protein
MLALSPTYVDLRALQDWLHDQAPQLGRKLKDRGIQARDLILPFLADPQVRRIRARWRNERPFLSDTEILVLLLLFAKGKKVCEIDATAYVTAVGVLMIMSAPDPWPAKVRIDFQRGKLLFP